MRVDTFRRTLLAVLLGTISACRAENPAPGGEAKDIATDSTGGAASPEVFLYLREGDKIVRAGCAQDVVVFSRANCTSGIQKVPAQAFLARVSDGVGASLEKHTKNVDDLYAAILKIETKMISLFDVLPAFEAQLKAIKKTLDDLSAQIQVAQVQQDGLDQQVAAMKAKLLLGGNVDLNLQLAAVLGERAEALATLNKLKGSQQAARTAFVDANSSSVSASALAILRAQDGAYLKSLADEKALLDGVIQELVNLNLTFSFLADPDAPLAVLEGQPELAQLKPYTRRFKPAFDAAIKEQADVAALATLNAAQAAAATAFKAYCETLNLPADEAEALIDFKKYFHVSDCLNLGIVVSKVTGIDGYSLTSSDPQKPLPSTRILRFAVSLTQIGKGLKDLNFLDVLKTTQDLVIEVDYRDYTILPALKSYKGTVELTVDMFTSGLPDADAANLEILKNIAASPSVVSLKYRCYAAKPLPLTALSSPESKLVLLSLDDACGIAVDGPLTLPRLRFLSIDRLDYRAVNPFIAAFAKLPELESLSLIGDYATGDAPVAIDSSPLTAAGKLRYLALGFQCGIGDWYTMDPAAFQPQVSFDSSAHMQMTPSSLQPLASLTSLKVLVVCGASSTDLTWVPLGPALEGLYVAAPSPATPEGAPVTLGGLDRIAQLPGLKALGIHGFLLKAEDLPPALPVQIVDLREDGLLGLGAIPSWHGLRTIDISKNMIPSVQSLTNPGLVQINASKEKVPMTNADCPKPGICSF